MELGVRSKIALVTGSTVGIGLAAAEALLRDGAHVIVSGRTSTRVAAALVRLRSTVPGCRVDDIAADLSTAAGCRSVIGRFAQLDMLLNNLGVFEPRPFEAISDADWLRLLKPTF